MEGAYKNMTKTGLPIQAFIFDLDGVITNTAEHHYLAWKAIADELHIPFTRQFNENLKGVSRMDAFDVIVDAAEIKNTKPDQEVFLKAAELLQVEPGCSVGIEDAVAGVQAIKAAGMFAVAIGAKEAFSHADLVLGSTSELTWSTVSEAWSARN